MTRDDIERLRAAETVILTPSHETNINRAMLDELLDAWLAWKLYSDWQEQVVRQPWPIGCGWTTSDCGSPIFGWGDCGQFPHPTPQAAVLAALGKQEATK